MTRIKHLTANHMLLATPVYASPSFVDLWPGAPEPGRSADIP
jgi:hypothetical protein